ncbi:MAG: M23 family metallopeptidase [Bacillota bacterium]
MDSNYNNTPQTLTPALRLGMRGAINLATAGGKALIRLLVTLLGPYLIPVIIVLFIFGFIYTALFLVPKSIVVDKKASGQEVVAIFNGGTPDTWMLQEDQALKKKYDQLGERWHAGMETAEQLKARLGPDWREEINAGKIISEYDQAEPYRLPWAVLAGVDRVLGDPTINGKKTFDPNPDKHYAALKPAFTWKTVTYTKIIEETVTVNQKTELKTRKVTASMRLLEEADTFEADYKFDYATKEASQGTAGIDQVTSHLQVLSSTEQKGPYYGPLTQLLKSYGIADPMDVELVLQLAMNYDDKYLAEVDLKGIADYGFSVDLTQQYWDGPTGTRSLPLPQKYMPIITSPFGMRLHPILHSWRMHTGVDFGAPMSTPVYAFQNGKVIFTGWMGATGNTVVIDHGSFKTQYGHLSQIGVKVSQEVASGMKVGEVGSTGTLSTGTHLHFEVDLIGDGWSKPVDPLPYLNN